MLAEYLQNKAEKNTSPNYSFSMTDLFSLFRVTKQGFLH